MTDLSRYRIFTEPQQGATYDTLLDVALHAERLGFDAFFRSDHYLAMGGALARGGLPGPTDAWITLAGLARDTERIRLGTLVTSATFRLPGPLAISVAGVDQMSGGRVELGLGAGWYEDEHGAYGIPFPDVHQRFDRLEEQLTVITGLWSTQVGETFGHAGPAYPIVNSPALPKPLQRGGVPIIVGGKGARRTPSFAARFAQEFNGPFMSLDEFATQQRLVREACERAGRDPDSLVYSAAKVVCCGATDAEVARRAAAIGREPAELAEDGIAGTPEQFADSVGRWHEAGAERLYFQILDLGDLDHLDLIASVVSN